MERQQLSERDAAVTVRKPPGDLHPGELGCGRGSTSGAVMRRGQAGVSNSSFRRDRRAMAQCYQGACRSRSDLEGASGASYLGCSYRPVELPNLRILVMTSTLAVTVGNSSEHPARLSVLEPGNLHQVTQLAWRAPVLCDDGNCTGANNRELNGLVTSGRVGAAADVLAREPSVRLRDVGVVWGGLPRWRRALRLARRCRRRVAGRSSPDQPRDLRDRRRELDGAVFRDRGAGRAVDRVG